ncbi:transmembrane amino acid transporter protein-domain-containing protein [Jimgerdemannia flammicorona]|uniref:Transmembrane amino acid transporter protein-domain-containing protein n=1 Tax=Jimgerdemannia flammicorona TaxID=994334 RepID=A0A433DB26_9FUNG|nr:transmembrane amino acid transporter protein-domain-containing protein [Jimgerdemannia flammicorona]
MSAYNPIFNDDDFDPPTNQHNSSSSARSSLPDDHAPLLHSPAIPPSAEDYEEEDDGHGSGAAAATAGFFGCTVNLANTILGTGMLAMPSAIASIGLIPGIFIIVYSATASSLGLYFLSKAAARTEGRHASFFTISKLTWPGAAILFDAAIAIKCFGVSISYLIIIGELMPEVVLSFLGNTPGGILSTPEGDDPYMDYLTDRKFWITVLMASVIVPISFFRKLDSLRYTSLIALFAVVYLVAIVVWGYVAPKTKAPEPGDIELILFHPARVRVRVHVPPECNVSTLVSFSPPISSMSARPYHSYHSPLQIFSVYNELKDNNQRVINSVITTSIGSAMGVYECIGILGYLTFGKNVQSNIIMEYPASAFITCGRIAIVVLVLFSYPLQAHPARASLDKILASRSPQASGLKILPPPSQLKYFLMTTGILVSSYLIAISVTRLDTVLSFVGSTGSTMISFILPGAFYYKIHEADPWHPRKIIAVFLAVYGCCVMTICLTYNISHLGGPVVPGHYL